MTHHDSYAKVARIYTFLEWGYSLGAIGRAKAAAISQIQPGERVFIAGCGTASEISGVIAPGAKLVLLDQSPSMLRFAPQRPEIETVICGDLFDYRPEKKFDRIIAPFFCNVFTAEELTTLFATFRALCHDQSKLCIVDFKYPRQSTAFVRLLQRMYWWFPMAISSILTEEKAHPPLDYLLYLTKLGWLLREQKSYTLPLLPIGYECLLFQKESP